MPRPASKPDKRNPQPNPPDVVSPLWLVKARRHHRRRALLRIPHPLPALLSGPVAARPAPSPHHLQPCLDRRHPLRTHPLRPRRIRHPATHRLVDSLRPRGRYAHFTILFLPDGDGSLADSIPTLATLHNLGINIFAFDYRGYGQSAATHPSQQNMTQDADSAWQYLTTSRAIPDSNRSSPTASASEPPSPPSSPHPPRHPRHHPRLTAHRPPRYRPPRPACRVLPVRLLFHESFPLAATALHPPHPQAPALPRHSAGPVLPHRRRPEDHSRPTPAPPPSLYQQSLGRFLDQYLPPTPVPAARTCLDTRSLERTHSHTVSTLLLTSRNLVCRNGSIVCNPAEHSACASSSVSPWPSTAMKRSFPTARSTTTPTTSPARHPVLARLRLGLHRVVGGILLILGLLTRLAAAFVAINMLVAFFRGIHRASASTTTSCPRRHRRHAALLGAGTLALDRKIGFA